MIELAATIIVLAAAWYVGSLIIMGTIAFFAHMANRG